MQDSMRRARQPWPMEVHASATAGATCQNVLGILLLMAMAVPVLFTEICFFGSPPVRVRPALRAAVASPPSTASSTSEVPPLLKFAGSAMGVLKPLFAEQAKVQAAEYNQEEVRAELEAEIKSAPVVLYTYGLSPFSSQAKRILNELGADYREIELGLEWFMLSKEAAGKRAELGAMFRQTSLPHVFIGGRSIGGLADGTPGLAPLLESGELTESLKQAGALPDDGPFGFFLYSGDAQKP